MHRLAPNRPANPTPFTRQGLAPQSAHSQSGRITVDTATANERSTAQQAIAQDGESGEPDRSDRHREKLALGHSLTLLEAGAADSRQHTHKLPMSDPTEPMRTLNTGTRGTREPQAHYSQGGVTHFRAHLPSGRVHPVMCHLHTISNRRAQECHQALNRTACTGWIPQTQPMSVIPRSGNAGSSNEH
jgi:hypothetical protein